ncbi:MAG: TIM barrel protein [Tepidisphaeraceae bacterium]
MTDDSISISRRRALAGLAGVAAAMSLPRFGRADDMATTSPATAAVVQPKRYKIAACDWTMLKRQTPGAITRAKEVGCDGVEVDMGPLSKNPTFDCKFLKDPTFVDKYLETCRNNGIEISSVAMSGYYAQSFPERDYEQPIKDCIATCKLLGVTRAFLPLGVSDVAERPWHYTTTVERLKRAGEWAAAAGVAIGVETVLNAESTCHFLDDIGSPGIKCYYNFQNGVRSGRDLGKELTMLGKDRLLQIHPTSNDVYWLKDDPAIKMDKVKEALDAMGWSGWLVIERSRDKDHGRDVVLNFGTNAKYLKSIFQS